MDVKRYVVTEILNAFQPQGVRCERQTSWYWEYGCRNRSRSV